MGRLTRPADPVLFQLLYEPQLASDRRNVLPYLLRIDAAHVVMLAGRGLLALETARALLAVNEELRRRLDADEAVLPAPATHRGLYFLYEQEYVERLGPQVGGAAHLARSRNDINATVARMRLRDQLLDLLADCCELLETMAATAGEHLETTMCGFTHEQPAQPTTLAHYLTGVLSELTRSVDWLDQAYAAVDCCPMGAAAGFGTSFPVDREEVARLLGFRRVVDNSADAVASRDYAVRVLSALAAIGVCLTRLATDLQAWAGPAHGFVGWPDDLVSTSSIMPQKRNPFVLENVRGLSTEAAAALVKLLLGLKNTPFGNSVEVSLEALSSLWPALEAGSKAVRLTRLLLDRLQAFPGRMAAFLEGTQATMTAVADMLVSRHALAFRTAHDAVGRLARETQGSASAAELRAALEPILERLTGRRTTLDEAELRHCLDARACVQAAAHGGGPSPSAVQDQLRSLARRHHRLRERLRVRRARATEAEKRLRDVAAEIRDVRFQGL
jgi:argininosuccinate lyase